MFDVYPVAYLFLPKLHEEHVQAEKHRGPAHNNPRERRRRHHRADPQRHGSELREQVDHHVQVQRDKVKHIVVPHVLHRRARGQREEEYKRGNREEPEHQDPKLETKHVQRAERDVFAPLLLVPRELGQLPKKTRTGR